MIREWPLYGASSHVKMYCVEMDDQTELIGTEAPPGAFLVKLWKEDTEWDNLLCSRKTGRRGWIQGSGVRGESPCHSVTLAL